MRFRGKLYRRGARDNDYELARRKLADFKHDLERTDATKGKTSFAKVLDVTRRRSPALVRQREEARRYREAKENMVRHRHAAAAHRQALQVKRWLAKHYGENERQLLQRGADVIRDALQLAVKDKIIVENPAAEA